MITCLFSIVISVVANMIYDCIRKWLDGIKN